MTSTQNFKLSELVTLIDKVCWDYEMYDFDTEAAVILLIQLGLIDKSRIKVAKKKAKAKPISK